MPHPSQNNLVEKGGKIAIWGEISPQNTPWIKPCLKSLCQQMMLWIHVYYHSSLLILHQVRQQFHTLPHDNNNLSITHFDLLLAGFRVHLLHIDLGQDVGHTDAMETILYQHPVPLIVAATLFSFLLLGQSNRDNTEWRK